MSVFVEHDEWCAALHVGAVVGSAGVVVDEPGVDLGAELGEAIETSSMKRGTPTFLERGALEPFADRVVVRGSRWGPVVSDLEFLEMGVEAVAELGTVVGEHPGDRHSEAVESDWDRRVLLTLETRMMEHESDWDRRVLLTLETRMMEHGNNRYAAEAAEVPGRAA